MINKSQNKNRIQKSHYNFLSNLIVIDKADGETIFYIKKHFVVLIQPENVTTKYSQV